MEASTFEPSSGGTGMRLNIARRILIKTTKLAISINAPDKTSKEVPKRIINPKINAIKMLTAGPAPATNASPHFWFERLYGLYGTGLAHPIRKLEPERSKIPGIITEPSGSMCFMGFKVRRPASLAVGSPNIWATYPCVTSCMTTEKISIII